MRADTVRHVAIEAHDDPHATGQVVVRLKDAGHVGSAPRFRLKLVDAPLGDPRWPDGEHLPVDVRETSDGVDVTIGAELANHPMLAPGTAVLIEIGNVRGEFLWPAVTPIQQARRRRVALRIVSPPPVVAVPLVEQPAHIVAAAVLEFERAEPTAAVIMAEPATPAAPAFERAIEVASQTSSLDPAAPRQPAVVTTAWPERTVAEETGSQTRPSAAKLSDDIPAIFRAEEWPTSGPDTSVSTAHAAHLSHPPAQPAGVSSDTPTSALEASRSAADVFPPTSQTPASSGPADQFEAVPRAAMPTASVVEPRAVESQRRRLFAPLDRIPAVAAAALGFGVITAVTAAVLMWPGGRSTADARGVAFQDQRRWQDGQVQRPVPAPAVAPVVAKAPPVVERVQPPATLQPPPATPSAANQVAASAATCAAPEPKTIALPAGMMSISVRSSCRRQQAVTVSYAGLEFKRRFDADGGLDMTIDCIFGAAQPVIMTLVDGKTVSVPMSCLDLDRVSKVALIWRQPVDLDLHVFERPAAPGTAGLISMARPGMRDVARDLATTERAARGFMSSLGSAKAYDGADGVRMTVYTAFHPPQTTTQTIPVAIDFATRGDTARGETCVGGSLASPVYEIVRLTARGQVTREEGQFAALTCGAVVAPTFRFNQSLHAPLRIRN